MNTSSILLSNYDEFCIENYIFDKESYDKIYEYAFEIIKTNNLNINSTSKHITFLKKKIQDNNLINTDMITFMNYFFKICCVEAFEYNDLHIRSVANQMHRKFAISKYQKIKENSIILSNFWTAALWTSHYNIYNELNLHISIRLVDSSNCIHKCRKYPPNLEINTKPSMKDHINVIKKINSLSTIKYSLLEESWEWTEQKHLWKESNKNWRKLY
jgi:hypothetical protein